MPPALRFIITPTKRHRDAGTQAGREFMGRLEERWRRRQQGDR